MTERPLVMRHEYWLAEGAALALIAALLLRGGTNWLPPVLRGNTNWLQVVKLGLFDSQLLLGCLLLAALYLAGSFVSRRLAGVILHPVGGLAWLVALVVLVSLIPLPPWRDLWWYSPLLRRPLSDTTLLVGAVLVVIAAGVRFVSGRRDLALMTGHGYRWILDWAAVRPLYARLRARALLRALGYRG